MAIIFVRTRHVYGSYQDYYRLIELSGFPTCYVDEIPDSGVKDNVYIVTPVNGEWNNGIKTDARVIYYALEWDVHLPVPGITEVWHMDAAFAKRCGYKYVPVGGHPELVSPPIRDAQFQYDVAYLNYMTWRRQVIQGQFVERGVSMTPTSLWDAERDAALRSCRVYVHVHQREEKEAQGVPGLRMVVAAAHRMPVISEEVEDRGIFGYSAMMCSDYTHLAEFTDYNLKGDWRRLEDYGWALHGLLTEQHTFRKVIEEAL